MTYSPRGLAIVLALTRAITDSVLRSEFHLLQQAQQYLRNVPPFDSPPSIEELGFALRLPLGHTLELTDEEHAS